MLAGEVAAMSTSVVARDNVETQVVDVMSLEPPAEPSCFISPDHSASSKRETYQSKRIEGVQVEAPQEIATPQKKSDATPVTLPNEKEKMEAEHFTESEEAR